MSLQAPVVYIVLEDTERVARASFPKGNSYLTCDAEPIKHDK